MLNHSHRLGREIALVLGWLGILLLAAILLSYSPEDPGWSVADRHDDDGDSVHNWGGIVGAHIADVLLSVLGRSAYLLCIIAFISLHALLRPQAPESDERLGGMWCGLGVLLFILSSASLEHVRFDRHADFLPSGAGGGLGALVADSMLRLFGEIGASAILLGIWMISWSLAAALSWFAFFEMIGGRLEQWICAIYGRLQRLGYSRHGARARQQRADAVDDAQRTKNFNLRPAPKPAAAPKPVKKPPPAPAPIPSQRTPPAVTGKNATPLPSVALLDVYESNDNEISQEWLAQNSELIEQTLQSFGVSVKVIASHPGPVITRYDIQPDTGVKGAQIVSLVRDLARSLSVEGIRILETIPGKNCMGLEIPNQDRATVYFSELIADECYTNSRHILPLTLGKDATGKPAISDLTEMPHLLVAGATGSGKSVCVNAMLLSLLFSSSPEKLGLILIDPKMLELASYHDIPHLLAPVVTDVTLAPAALNWAVEEMESRYRLMSAAGVRNIASYNQKLAASPPPAGEGEPPKRLPYIVIVIDELADLMMTTGKKVEITISRLAQKARASGIHLILATQRPSVDVITGLIKANVPCRIAFQVASKVDSRTIIDQMGADMLLGKGDMLYLPAGSATPLRVHGAYISDEEVRRVSDHLRKGPRADYAVDFNQVAVAAYSAGDDSNGSDDELYAQAVEAVMQSKRPSISLVQRKLRIGYNRAARLIEEMEKSGLVSPIDEQGVRKFLSPPTNE